MQRKASDKEQQFLPRHVAIIMDGNGRWAEKRGLLRHEGHEQGSKVAEDIVRYANELGIRYITLYAFSSENWQRPREEVDAVMKILERYIKNDINELIKNDIKIGAIGDLNRLPDNVKDAIDDAAKRTAHCKKLTITLALSYGAWDEIIAAVKKIVSSQKDQSTEHIDENFVRKHLYTHDLPDPDLFIRTGGEVRLSNFLLMQISYSELYFSKTLWPDFQRADLDLALKSFLARKRRFGGVFSD